MKTVNRLFGILLGATALFLSCTKQENPVRQEGNTFEMTIVAGSDQTRTVLGSYGTVTWSASGEQLAVMEVANGTKTTTSKASSNEGVTTDEGTTMSFGVSMTAKTADSFDYYALYPNSAYLDTPSDFKQVKVKLASTQVPTKSSFGPSADVLVAKPVTGLTTQPKELNLQFARVIAVGKMTINNLNTTENVKKVTFTAAGKAVTGRSYIDFTTAAGVEYGYSNQGVDNVVLDYSGKTIAANGMTAYFTCWPFELAAGETFSVVVETENYTFTKNITLAKGKSLAFNVGRASAFNVNFDGIEGVEKKQTWTWTAASGDLGTTTPYSATLNEKAWTVTRSKVVYTGFSSSCIQLGSSSGAETVTLTSNAFSGTIKSVSVECSSYNAAHTVDITVGGTSYASGVSTAKWSTVGTVSGTGTSSGEIVIKFNAGSRALYIKSISITYEGGSEPMKLDAPVVSCTAQTETSLTFTWEAIDNASGYQVSTDGGSTYGSTQDGTSYIWTGLSANTSYTLYVKAIGDNSSYTDSEAATAKGTTTAGSGSGETPGVTTVSLDETEIKALGKIAYTDLKTIKDGDVTWTVYAYKDNESRPWLQLKKDSGVYVKISAPSAIKEVRLTITGASNSSGGIEDISKHDAYSSSGTISLKSDDAAGNTTKNDVVSCTGDAISNNNVTLVPNGSYKDLYLKVSAGARIWGIEVDY